MNFHPDVIGKTIYYALEEFKTLESFGADLGNALDVAVYYVFDDEPPKGFYDFTLQILQAYANEGK